jgi:hypothetical protein
MDTSIDSAVGATRAFHRCLAAADVGAAPAEPGVEVDAGVRVPACAKTPALAGATAV